MTADGPDTTAAATVDRHLVPGERLGVYQVTGPIGGGAHGIVYAAVQANSGQQVAVKVLSAAASAQPERISRFAAEAQVVNQLGHPNIVRILASGQRPEGSYYQVMERLEGVNLARWLKQWRRLSPAEVLPILRPIAFALDAAHSAGVLHRDLSPTNVFLHQSENGTVPKLLDFGMANLLEEPRRAPPDGDDEAIGRLQYASPEQCLGERVDQRADVYALGVLCFQLLTGGLPFLSRSRAGSPDQPQSTTPRDPRVLAPQLGDATAQALLKMLERRPVDRPDSAGGAVALLQTAITADAEPPHPTTPGPTPPAAQLRSSVLRSQQRRRAIWWGALVALALALLGLALLLSRAPESTAPLQTSGSATPQQGPMPD